MVPLSLLAFAFAGTAASFFAPDPAVSQAAAIYLRAVAWCFPFCAVEACFDGGCSGAQRTVLSMVLGVLGNGLRLPLAALFAQRYGVAGGWSESATNFFYYEDAAWPIVSSITPIHGPPAGGTAGRAGGTVFVEVATRRRAPQSNGGTEMHWRPKALVRVVSEFLRKTIGVGTVTSQTPRNAGRYYAVVLRCRLEFMSLS